METPILGSAGLVGRPSVRPANLDDLEPTDLYDGGGRRVSMPANCMRVMSSPLAAGCGGGCSHDCPGVQRDGGCLVDIVRAANEQGIEWSFWVDHDGYWIYEGPPLTTEAA